MNIAEVLKLYDQEQRIDIVYPDEQKEVFPHVIRFYAPLPRHGFVLYGNLRNSDIDSVIQQQIDFFTARKQTFAWKVYDHDYPADLRERLVARGFEAKELEAIMVLDLHQAPDELLAPVRAEVRSITHREQLGEVQKVLGGCGVVTLPGFTKI